MKVFVTGANGLLGCNVVRQLVSEGHEVRIFIRPDANTRGLKGVDFETIHGDLLDEYSVIRAITGCDAIIHAAANTNQWPTDFRLYEAVNVKGTAYILNAARKNSLRKLIHVSTANTFGYGTKTNPGTEQTQYAFHHLQSGYIESKYQAQQLALDEYQKHNMPVVIVNPAFMIGPYDVKPSSGKIIRMGLNKKIRVFPPGGKNFIHVRDAAVAICNALTLGVAGECYLLANENLTYGEFFSMVNRITNQHPLMVRLPGIVVRSAGVIGSMIETITHKPLSLNNVNAQLITIGNYYSGRKAADQLKMPQTPVETAVREAIEWWDEQQ